MVGVFGQLTEVLIVGEASASNLTWRVSVPKMKASITAFIHAFVYSLVPRKCGSRPLHSRSNPVEGFDTEKWTTRWTPDPTATSNSVLVFSTAWSKVVCPCVNPYPVGVVEDARPLHRPAQPVRVREVQRGHFHQTAQWVAPCRSAAEGPHGDALVDEMPGDVSAGVDEGPDDDGHVGGQPSCPAPTREGENAAAQASVGGPPDVCPPFGMR